MVVVRARVPATARFWVSVNSVSIAGTGIP
jgi:hypothetical protein